VLAQLGTVMDANGAVPFSVINGNIDMMCCHQPETIKKCSTDVMPVVPVCGVFFDSSLKFCL
jgi:hypothetical protein